MAYIKGISYYLPDTVLSNNELNLLFPDWSVGKIAAKTGIIERHIAANDEFVSTMAVKAARRLFEEYNISPEIIEYIILCTQSPDYLLPTTACLVQEALNVPTSAGALDINLGCSGYIYGLNLAKGLILTGDVKNVLFITADTYSKHLSPDDKSVRTIFGDGAAATFISDDKASGAGILKSSFGTDGKGASNLIVKGGGMRSLVAAQASVALPEASDGLKLYMNGAEIFTFTLRIVPEMVANVLKRNNLNAEDIDLFVFHQANKYMLEHLRMKLNIAEDKFYLHISHCGNTVSSTIPIALKSAMDEGRIKAGMRVLLAGFGVGYSWGATLIQY
ncbi:ketoacyl-ACP synthase III [Chitinophaga ginsengisegetis]|uniref:3-oxoacyl-ACP synthase III family protein n=1 Tax=Chitinophaga ginsengisegetis TaxID=393003 RepID=UPI003430CECB